jgi:hypothetical protein
METRGNEAGTKRIRLTKPLLVVAVTVLVLVVSMAYFLSLAPTTKPPPTITFDFDTGSPILAETQNTPLNQTSNGVTALFSSPSDIASPAFSVQSYDTTFVRLPQFSGKWLYDNKPAMDSLDIMFSQQLTSITLTFATVEYHGGPETQPSNITLTAYMNSINSTPVGLATTRGTFADSPYPQGTLSLNSGGQPFNLVRIEILYQGPEGAMDFFVDNITIKPVQQK